MTVALDEGTSAWLAGIGVEPAEEALWRQALTHGSREGEANYERLEFLGDRVLGLAVAAWLYEAQHTDEGQLSQRLNALVSRATCARVARALGLPDHVLLGKQARGDGAQHSDNVLGDVMEAMLGAHFREHGFAPTAELVHRWWQAEFDGAAGRSKHPKSALQEWAAGNDRRMPEYSVVDVSGPDHDRRFTVEVGVHKVGSAQAKASSKQEAEKLAAKKFMEDFG